MNRILRASLVLLLLAVPLSLVADQEADHQALREVRALYERAVNEDRLDLLAPHIGEPFYGVMITGKRVSNLAEMKAYWADMKRLMGPNGKYQVKVTPERSAILGDIAMARGTTADVVTSYGQTFRFGTSWTAVLHRQNGMWKIVQVQGSMDPVNNEFVKKFRRNAILLYGGGMALVALVLGWLLGGRRSRVKVLDDGPAPGT